jgi:hypothetical protein
MAMTDTPEPDEPEVAEGLLDVPPWLAELAARDDPPTTITDVTLKRLERAGVLMLLPAVGREIHPVERATDATGIGVVGPGLAFGETFEGEAAPIAASLARLVEFLERFDELRRIRLAAIDMRNAEHAARGLLDQTDAARVYERVLETGLVVTYARPYLKSNKASRLKDKWQPPARDRDFHRYVMDLRHRYHAHTDRSEYRSLTDAAAHLGLEGHSTYVETWQFLNEAGLERLATLAAAQAERFEAKALELGVQLGERRRDDSENPWRSPA